MINFCADAISGAVAPGIQRLAYDRHRLLVEGGKWKGVWSQNYFGMCCTTPFLEGKLLEYHTNTLRLFFDFQADGVKGDANGFVGPSGALPEWISTEEEIPVPRYKNDESCGHAEQFDFWVEGNAASVLSLADLLLMTRDREMTARYLPAMEKTLAWILSRRDQRTGLLKIGVSGILIERAYGATYRGPGKSDYGLPSGAVVNTAKALDVTAELEEFAGNAEKASEYRQAAAALQEALKQLVEANSYLINYIDADGIRHGVLGAPRHNYLEGNANVDMAAWGALPDEIANAALDKLRRVSPTPLAVSVWPIHDDAEPTYQKDDPAYGGAGSHWNGAAWFSTQARYLYALLRNNRFDEAYAVGKCMRDIHATGTLRDVMDDYGRQTLGEYNPDTEGAFYIDGFGTFGGFLRGLFAIRFRANTMELAPHLPAEMTSYKQIYPLRWGDRRISLVVTGAGSSVSQILLNGTPFAATYRNNRFAFPFDALVQENTIEFVRK
ncbi:MAG: hypothetical protein MJ106_06375 [Lentisphaeria bacterium]|nr:hypothetical protein [Lentisphaeria bacterium]